MTHHIVIVGAGYGGIATANRLAGLLQPHNFHITLVNAEELFVERVRLHQVATGQDIKPLRIADMVSGAEVELRVGRVAELDLESKVVSLDTDSGSTALEFDTLVYSLGSGAEPAARIPGLEYAFLINHRPGAEALRSHLASVESGSRAVIVGGGLTGLELAGELAESRPDLQVHLVSDQEPGHWLSPRGKRYLRKVFEQLNIDVSSGAAVAALQPHSVVLDNGEVIDSTTTVWTAGFGVHTLAAHAGLEVTSQGRIIVGNDLQSVSHPEVFAVGDAASMTDQKTQCEVPMACGTAVPMGVIAARSIARRLTESGRRPARLRLEYLAQHLSLGRKRGIVQLSNYGRGTGRVVATGRYAAWQKERVLRSGMWFIQRPRVFSRRSSWVSRRRNLNQV